MAEGTEELIRYRARGHPARMRIGEMASQRMSSKDDEANGREDEEEDDDDEPEEETDDE